MQSGFNSCDKLLTFSHNDQNSSLVSNRALQDKQNRTLKKIYAKGEIIEDCLSTLDIFKCLMEEADQMKNKIIRDVSKTIYIQSFEEGHIIYDVQQQANQIFLVFQGQVALKIKEIVQSETPTQIAQEGRQQQYVYKQVQTYQKGQGFGQAQFIRGRNRDFQAFVKTSGSVIGRLHIQSFEQVVQNYKLRIYYKKLEMFKRCPLLSGISSNRLEFIVNNSKPIILGISKTLTRQGQLPKFLYLVSKGQLQLVKNNQKDKGNLSPLGSWKSKKISKYFLNSFQSKEKLLIRKINEGAFVGDAEIALNLTFNYQVKAASEKVYLYACDIRLILSQIPVDQLQKTKKYYEDKMSHQQIQLKQIKETRRVATQKSDFGNSLLSPDQIKIKRQIRKRYVDGRPFSLVDQSSPQQIFKMLERKRSRMKTEPIQSGCKLPVLELFCERHISKVQIRQNQYQMKRRLSIQVQNYFNSPRKDETLKIKSQRTMRTMDHTNERLNIYSPDKREARRIYKKKKYLPPIICLPMTNKNSPSKKNSEKCKTQQSGPRSEMQLCQRNRIKQFIHRIHLFKGQKTSKNYI